MLKPIKRVWVPPPAVPPAAAVAAAPPTSPPAARKPAISELPETEVEERNSDSIWAEFESVYARAAANKASPA